MSVGERDPTHGLGAAHVASFLVFVPAGVRGLRVEDFVVAVLLPADARVRLASLAALPGIINLQRSVRRESIDGEHDVVTRSQHGEHLHRGSILEKAERFRSRDNSTRQFSSACRPGGSKARTMNFEPQTTAISPM